MRPACCRASHEPNEIVLAFVDHTGTPCVTWICSVKGAYASFNMIYESGGRLLPSLRDRQNATVFVRGIGVLNRGLSGWADGATRLTRGHDLFPRMASLCLPGYGRGDVTLFVGSCTAYSVRSNAP